MKNSLGKKIKDIRDSNNLSQRRFAHKLGVSPKSISAYETGKCKPSLKVLEKISDTYNVNLVSFTPKYKSKMEERITELEKLIIEMKQIFSENLSI